MQQAPARLLFHPRMSAREMPPTSLNAGPPSPLKSIEMPAARELLMPCQSIIAIYQSQKKKKKNKDDFASLDRVTIRELA